MRTTIVPAVVLAALTLAACGGSDDNGASDDAGADSGADQTTSSEETPADDGEEEGGGAVADLSTALLTAEDLPEGAQVQPIDAAQFSPDLGGMTEMEDITYEPAECADPEGTSNPLARASDVAAITATVGEAPSIDVLFNAVHGNAKVEDIDAITDYAQRCATTTVSGTISGQPIDMTVTNTVAEAPDVDVDAAVAIDTTVEAEGAPTPSTRVVYLVDGDYGVMMSANPESSNFDLDALTQTALDKLHAAQG